MRRIYIWQYSLLMALLLNNWLWWTQQGWGHWASLFLTIACGNAIVGFSKDAYALGWRKAVHFLGQDTAESFQALNNDIIDASRESGFTAGYQQGKEAAHGRAWQDAMNTIQEWKQGDSPRGP